MKHKNIAIFIPHLGCPNMCSFCNQQVISGTTKAPTASDVSKILDRAWNEIDDKANTEIAFFGGSFTAIPQEYMVSLLQAAQPFLEVGGFCGIRISTRPDAIYPEILTLLKRYGVTTIELGAQSMNDIVLEKNLRGHTANDVITASQLIRANGFSLGLQMMVGLYGDTVESVYHTGEQLLALKPDTVRIYPVVVLKGTKLAQWYRQGVYSMMPMDEAVSVCGRLLLQFEQNNIKVIKLGLHASKEVQEEMIAGIYHPAFRELCESKVYFEIVSDWLKKQESHSVIVEVNPRNLSKMIGQKKSNIIAFEKMGYHIQVLPNQEILDFKVKCRSQKL